MKTTIQQKPSNEVAINKELNKLDVAKLSQKKLERANKLLKGIPFPQLPVSK